MSWKADWTAVDTYNARDMHQMHSRGWVRYERMQQVFASVPYILQPVKFTHWKIELFFIELLDTVHLIRYRSNQRLGQTITGPQALLRVKNLRHSHYKKQIVK